MHDIYITMKCVAVNFAIVQLDAMALYDVGRTLSQYKNMRFRSKIRLLEDTSTSLKQKQDNLAAQLQVAHEQKSRLQNQVDLGINSLKVLKDEYVSFRYGYLKA